MKPRGEGVYRYFKAPTLEVEPPSPHPRGRGAGPPSPPQKSKPSTESPHRLPPPRRPHRPGVKSVASRHGQLRRQSRYCHHLRGPQAARAAAKHHRPQAAVCHAAVHHRHEWTQWEGLQRGQSENRKWISRRWGSRGRRRWRYHSQRRLSAPRLSVRQLVLRL